MYAIITPLGLVVQIEAAPIEGMGSVAISNAQAASFGSAMANGNNVKYDTGTSTFSVTPKPLGANWDPVREERERSKLLAEADHNINKLEDDQAVNSVDHAAEILAWRTYRIEVRDITNSGTPETVSWPDKP